MTSNGNNKQQTYNKARKKYNLRKIFGITTCDKRESLQNCPLLASSQNDILRS